MYFSFFFFKYDKDAQMYHLSAEEMSTTLL